MSLVRREPEAEVRPAEPAPEARPVEELERLHEALRAVHADGLWRYNAQVSRQDARGQRVGTPHVWRWADLHPLLLEAAGVVTVGRGGERRVLLLANPSLESPDLTTNTLTSSLQIINPGEVAPAHRHTAAAIRFIIRGEGAYTTVAGEKIPMEEGDLTLTPSWSVHDHGNDGEGPVIWLDGLDLPIARFVGNLVQRPYRDLRQIEERPLGYTLRRVGTGLLRPPGTRFGEGERALPLIYRWRDTYPALRAQATGELDPFDGAILEYVNPIDGGPTLPTINCCIQLLPPGFRGRAHSHASSAVYHVFRGRGATIIDGVRYAWSQGDTFALPTHAVHEHLSDPGAESVLFSFHDAPVLKKLGLYREEPWVPNGGHQEVVS